MLTRKRTEQAVKKEQRDRRFAVVWHIERCMDNVQIRGRPCMI